MSHSYSLLREGKSAANDAGCGVLRRACAAVRRFSPTTPARMRACQRSDPAPEFKLTDQDGKPFALRDLRGKVAVVTFIFTTCSDTCPLLTAKLIGVQKRLGADQSKVFFTAITVDPLNDTPPVLKKYAQAHSADLSASPS